MKVVVIEKSVLEQACKDLNDLTHSLQLVVASYQGLCQGEKWLDTQEVCLMLGISKRALQNYKDQKILPCSFIHRKNYFKMSDVQALLSSQNFKK